MTWRSPLYDEIASIIGDSAARSLVHVYPGSRLYVPMPANLDPKHPIPALIGMILAMRLATRYGGDMLVMPTAAGIALRARNTQITTMHSMGRSAGEIARRFGLTERWVWRIITTARESEISGQ